MPKQTLEQFGAAIKAKHPEYKDMDDTALAQAVLKKYPQYADMVESEPVSTDPSGRTPTGEPAPGDKRNAAQRYLDNLIAPDPRREEWQSPLRSGVDDFAQHVASSVVPLISHPLESAKGMVTSVGHALAANPGSATGVLSNLSRPLIEKAIEDYQQHGPVRGTTDLLGTGTGMLATGEVGGGLLRRAGAAGRSLREAAIGDPNVAALKGLRVGPASPKSLATIRAVEGARPFLKGVSSLEDLQSKIPAAKSEIWGPYQQTVDAIGDKTVRGPDGPTTVRALEKERQQLSALNRGLKKQNPEAIQLAQQKGMTQAQLLDRERAVQSALDPELEAAGVDPKLIRQTFGQVSQIGERVSGKSTLAEKPQPFGFGKIANLSVEHPLQAPAQIFSGVRDLAAGRPWWSGSPTDVALREAFRIGGPKPDFRAPISAMPRYEFPPLQLPESVIPNADISESPRGYLTGGFERSPSATIPAAPPSRLRLPSTASGGEPQPMLRYARPYIEPEPQGIRTPVPPTLLRLPAETGASETQPYIAYRPAPPLGERLRVLPSRYARLQMQGGPLPSSGEVRGLLPAPDVPTPSPEPTTAHIYPAGSAYRNLAPETPLYPAGSQFRPSRVAPFDIDEYLRGQAKPLVPPQGTQ